MTYFGAIYHKHPPNQGSKKNTRIGPMGLDIKSSNPQYCWWKRSQTTTWHVWNPGKEWDIYHINWWSQLLLSREADAIHRQLRGRNRTHRSLGSQLTAEATQTFRFGSLSGNVATLGTLGFMDETFLVWEPGETRGAFFQWGIKQIFARPQKLITSHPELLMAWKMKLQYITFWDGLFSGASC